MLPRHKQNASHFPSHFELSGSKIAVNFEQALTDPRFEIENRRERWPFFFILGYFRMFL